MYLLRGRSIVTCVLLVSLGVGFFLTNQSNGQSTIDNVMMREQRDVNVSPSYFYYQQPDYPRDCQEVYDDCHNDEDGVYLIKPDGYPEPFEVFCNNTIDSGGWTVFQRRLDGGVDFHRDWTDYKTGFGFLHRDFWLGNEKIASLTNQKDYEFRLDMVDSTGSRSYAYYDLFRVSDEGTKYSLVGLGSYNGTIGAIDVSCVVEEHDVSFPGINNSLDACPGYDYFAYHRNRPFTTRDRDNDARSSENCAVNHHDAWWFGNCYNVKLNGNYHSSSGTGICLWDSVNYSQCSIRYTEMKIRPKRTSG